MRQILGIDQSLTSVGIASLEVEDDYVEELNKIYEILRELIIELNTKSANLPKITKESKLKRYNFHTFISGLNYTKKSLEIILNKYDELHNLMEEFKKIEKFNYYKELHNSISNQKSFKLETKYFVETINNKQRSTKRLFEIEEILNEMYSKNDFSFVSLEGYSYGSSGATRSVFDLGELGGMIRLFNYKKEKDGLIISPSTIKKFIANHGLADKDMVIEAFENIFDIKFELTKKSGKVEKLDDIYDAFSISLFNILVPYMNIEELLKCKLIK